MAGDYSPPRAPEETLSVVLLVSVAVEIGRILLYHPDFRWWSRWTLLVTFAVVANLAYHAWNRPERLRHAAVSAFLTEAGMPTLVQIVGTALWSLLRQIITDVPGYGKVG